jgi:hypothetical protein
MTTQQAPLGTGVQLVHEILETPGQPLARVALTL